MCNDGNSHAVYLINYPWSAHWELHVHFKLLEYGTNFKKNILYYICDHLVPICYMYLHYQ